MLKELSDSKFKAYIEKKVRQTINRNKLFTRDEKIGVAASGGKDSTVCLYILKKLGYNVEGITIDAAIGNYTKKNLENLRKVCKNYDIKLHEVSFRKEFGMSLCYIRSVLKSKGYRYSSCMICGILKRYLLNKFSRKFKFDCLATGHNLDDEAQSVLMNVFRNDFKLARRQGPITGIVDSSKFVKRVKPLYYIREDEVERYSKIMKFPVNYEICPCSVDAYRREYKEILDNFEKKHPCVKYNIINFQQKMKAHLKEDKDMKIDLCENCGEPSSNLLCKACKIISELKSVRKEGKK